MVKISKGFDCLDCPALATHNCYYYCKGFIDYYKKIQREKEFFSHQWSLNLEIVDFNL